MLFSKVTFIGIDPTNIQPLAFAALSRDLHLVRLDIGSLEEISAFAAGQESAFIAVCAPQRLSQGLMAQDEYRARLEQRPRAGRYGVYRVAEYLLRQQGIAIPPTPAQGGKVPGWMQVGFSLYQRLAQIGYIPYAPGLESAHQVMEAYPHGIFTVLLNRAPFPKHTLEGRVQRQLVLYMQNLRIPDPMGIFEEITRHRILQGILPLEGLYSQQQLDALAAAYLAWLAATRPDQVALVGDPNEGQIVMPLAELGTPLRYRG